MASFIKKCSKCGKMGAPHQITNEQGETENICPDCFKQEKEKSETLSEKSANSN